MTTEKSASYGCLPSALFGVFAGAAAWASTAWARSYCDAGYDAGGRFELNFLLIPIVLAGGLSGVTVWAVVRRLVQRAPMVVRTTLPTVLVITVTLSLALGFFATRGTLDGYPSDSGLCPASNIPPQWPSWIPA